MRRAALAPLEQQGIEALAIIGGNGSQAGAYALSEMGVPVPPNNARERGESAALQLLSR